jgi:hypothetical protein
MTTTPPAPTLTAFVDSNPVPRVEVLISTMPVDAATVTVWRNYAGRRSLVRGAVATPVAGDHVVVDYEAPLQTAVTYTCQTADADGVPSELSPASDAVLVDDSRAWLQDPLAPTTSVALGMTRVYGGGYAFGEGDFGEGAFGSGTPDPIAVLRRASFGTVNRSADVTVTPLFGGSLPVAGSSVRRAPSEIPIEIRTTTEQTSTALRDLLNQAFPVLLRIGARAPMLEPLSYLVIPEVAERFIYGAELTIWTMTGQSVMPPSASVVIPVRTYNDLLDEASSYDDLLGLYDSYVALLRGH